ncbi:MAG TPA: hypothetical protein VN609_00015 [Propionibacteriaceae bacterium]|jgi:hypothetical protein|nr:hypothetical protein [Propionibacteriaceae bacterium]
MADTTTVRVKRSTHEALSAAARDHAVSADEVITAGLRALAREEKRRAFEEAARRLGSDPDDRAEVAAAIRDVLGE